MARPELVVNISASSPTGSNSNSNSNGSSYTRGSPRPGYASPDHHLTSRSPPPPSIPEHYTASRAALTPTPVSIPERAAASSPLRHHRHAYSKESMREYTSSLGGGGGGGDPSRHSSLTSRPTAASPPPMSYHSTTPFAAQPQGASGGHGHGHDRGNGSTGGARPRASHASMGTHTSNTVTTIVAAIEADPSNGWRPGWLRKRVIGAFVGVFILMGVCAEISMAVADGTEADSRVEGLWTFGPVIIISLLATVWWRVEFQALNYTPWIVLDIDQGEGIHGASASERQASRTILLDYVSMTYPGALLTAVRNRHYLAAASVSVSLLLRVQIFLSTSIFHVYGGGVTPATLVIQPGILHAMVGIFGLMALLTVPMVFSAPGAHGITPRDPTTIAGTAALLANSFQPMAKLRATGSQDMDVVAHRLRGAWCTTLLHQPNSRPAYEYRLEQFETTTTVGGEKYVDETEEFGRPYTPWTHQSATSIAAIVVCVGLIAGLWVLFTLRGTDRPFNASDGAYFLWTSLVTLFFVAFSMFLSSISFQVQRLAPYFKLLARACSYDESLGLNYTNAMGFRSFVKASRYRDWGVVITTVVAFVGWLMPIFSAGLFVDRQRAHEIQAELQQQTFFRTDISTADVAPDATLVQSVLLNETPEYPAWTYQDLAFPSQSLVFPAGDWTPSGERVVTTVPAVRASMKCELQQISIKDAEDIECEPLMGDGKRKAVVCEENPVIGFTASSCTKLSTESTFNYVWGACRESASLSVLMCNETMVEVTTKTTFEGESLGISNTSIPIADDSTEKPADISIEDGNTYELLRGTGAGLDGLDGLDDFFRALVQSPRQGVDRVRLGTPGRANSVREAIRLQHGIVRAQLLNSAGRASFDSASDQSPPAPIVTTATYYVRQVLQSAPQTALLTAALGLALCLILGWLLAVKPSPAALPKNPGSIAAQASLLADSSLWWHLPRGVEWLAERKLARRLRRKTFRLGWFEVMAPGPQGTTITERACTVGVVQDNGRAMRAPWDEGEAWVGSTRRGADLREGRM